MINNYYFLSTSSSTFQKKIAFMLFFIFFSVLGATAQVAVTVTNPSNALPALQPSYTSLADAITDLNAVTSVSGPITLTADPGSETAPAGGYVIGFTAATSLTDNVVITGTATTTITAFGGQTSGNLNDAIFKIVGSDYVTIQNFTMQENGANTTTAVATNNMTEFGVALFYSGATNGAQNNIIQNNTISLNRTYSNTFGIYSSARHTAAAVTATAEASAASGSNSGNKVYSNAISNVDFGIVFEGSATAAAMDSGNDVGGASLATANTITNWGGFVSGAPSAYVGLLTSNFGIIMTNQINENTSFNTVVSATNITTLTTTGFGGIIKTYSAQPTGTITANYNGNTITLTNAATTSQMTAMGLQGLTTLSTATFNANNNNILNCAVTGAGATSASMIGFLNSSAPGTFNVTGNTIRGFTTTATTGGFIGIQQQTNGVVTALNINNNNIGDATAGAITFSSATSGTFVGFAVLSASAASTCTVSISSNTIRGVVYSSTGTGAFTGITNAASASVFNANSNNIQNFSYVGGAAAFTGIINSGTTGLTVNIGSNNFTNLTLTTTGTCPMIAVGSPGGTANVTNNAIQNITNTAASGIMRGIFATTPVGLYTVTGNTIDGMSYTTLTSTGTINGIYNLSSATQENWNNNIIRNLSTPTTGALVGITNNTVTGTFQCKNNQIYNFSTNAGGVGGGTFTGITWSNASVDISGNQIYSLNSSGTTGGAVVGIIASAATALIYKNKIYDLSTTSSTLTVVGIAVSGATTTIYNNRIADLRAPLSNIANALIGINITGGTTSNVYYNTVYLAGSSSGALFGSSAISVSTTPTATLRNNIFVNNSSANGAGLAVAYRRSTATLTSYGSASNNNDFYASTIYTDGTTPQVTFSAYKALVTPRDNVSVNVNPSFQSTTGSSANFLKMNTAASQIESGGANIATFTDDFDGDIRQGNPGYLAQVNGGGTAPDIGADEYDGIKSSLCTGTPATATINGLAAVCTGSGTTLSLSIPYNDLGITYQWKSSTTPGGPYTTLLGTSPTQATGNLTVPTYYIAEVTCTNAGTFTMTTVEKSVLINALPPVAASPSTASYCTPGGSAVAITASGASTYVWSPSAGLSATTGASVNASPSATTTYTVTGTDANGCVNTATSTINVAASVAINTVTATPATICSGGTSQLQASITTAASYNVTSITTPVVEVPGAAPVTTLATATGFPYNTSGTLGDDSYSNAVALPFAFNFTGSAVTQMWVSSNGYITFSDPVAIAALAQRAVQTFPSTATPNNVISLFWHDMDIRTLGNVKYYTIGSSPNRKFVIEFNGVPTFASTTNLHTGQIVLNETSNVVQLYVSVSGSAAKTLGIENSGGTSGATPAGRNNATWAVSALEGWQFTVPTATYSWTPSTFLSDATIANPVASGVTSTTTYSVTASIGGCTTPTPGTVTVTVDALAGQAATTSGALCSGSNFTVTANKTGGGAPYHYAWNDGNGGVYGDTATITANMPAGTHTFVATVTDNCGGSVTSQVTVTVVAGPVVTLTPSTGSICNPGGAAVALTAGGADTYTYTNNTSLTPTTGANVSANPTVTTTYVVTGTVTATGCSATASSTITVGAKPAVTLSPTAVSACPGVNTTLTASSGSATLEGVLSAINSNTAALLATIPTPTSFDMDGTNGVNGSNISDGCSDMYDTGNILNTNLASTIVYSDNTVLSNAAAFGTGGKYFTRFIGSNDCVTGSASMFYWAADVNGLTSMSITGDLGADGSGSQDLNEFTVTANGTTYNCYLKRYYGATDPSINQLYMIPQPTTAVQAMGTTAANSNNLHTLTSLSGVTRVYYMLYAGAAGAQISVASATSIAQTFANTITPPVVTYSWSTGATTPSITVAPTTTTTYTVTTFNAGCPSDPVSATITVSPLVGTAATASATKCAGSDFTVTANVSGGGTPYTYSWSDGSATSYPATATITANKPAGTYTFTATITDSCGGTTTSAVSVTVNATPNVAIASVPANAIICGTGTVSLTASGGSTYAWSPAAGLSATTGATVTASATANATTIYTVSSTDANGCIGTATKSVAVRSGVTGVTANATPSAACQGIPVNLTSSATVTGYTLDANSNVAFIDISGTGTTLAAPADDSEHNITIPSFTFNGVAYTTARVGNNGAVVFGTTTGDIIYTNSSLPQGIAASASATTGIITGAGNSLAALLVNWDDVTTSTSVTTTIKTQQVGNIYIIQWTDEDNFNATGTGTITFQVQLDLSNGQIHYVYNDITYGAPGFDGGGSTTVGLNYSATSALQYSFNTASLSDLQSLTFTPNTISSYAWTGPNSYSASTQNPTFTATNASAGSYVVTATSSSGCTGTATATVTEATPGVNITTQPGGSTTKCAGESMTFTVVATGGGLTYQWYYGAGTSNPISNGGRISGATSASLTITNVDFSDSGQYHVVVTSCSSLSQDSTIHVFGVNGKPSVTVSPTSTTVCNTSTPVTLTASGLDQIGQPLINFSWTGGTTPTTGATVSATATTTTTYTVTGTDDFGCTNTATATITVVNAPPTVTAGATATTICGGASTTLTASSGAETSQYTYTWYYASDSGFTTPLGTGSSFLVTPPVVLPTTGSTPPYAAPVVDYRVRAVKGDGSCGAPAIGDVSITINTDPIGLITSNATSLCLGTGSNPTSPALIDFNGEFSNTVTWLSSNPSVATIDGNGNIITNNTTSAAGTTVISARIVNIGTGCTTFSTNTATVSVNKPIVITDQPGNASIFQGGTASFSVSATGSGPSGPTSGLTYQWYVSTSENGVGTAISNDSTYSGATTNTLTISDTPIELNQLYFYATITGASVCSAPIDTSRGILTVDPYTVTNPADSTKCYDASSVTPLSTTFTVFTNMNLDDPANVLVWKFSTGGTTPGDFNDVSANSNFSVVNSLTATPGLYQSVLTFTNITSTNNNWKFVAEITPFPSEIVLATSAYATLTVNTAAVITSTPTTSTVCYSGGSTSFNVTASNSAGTQWQYTSAASPTEGDWTDITAGNASTLTTGVTYTNYTNPTLGIATTGLINAAGTFKYRARVTSQSQCPPVPSGVYQMFINTPIAVITPSSATYCNPGGAPVVLDATAAGITTYAWSTSASTPSISVAPTSTTTYTVTVTDATGCSKQASATVTVTNGITVNATATPSIFCSGSTVQLIGAGTIVSPALNTYQFTTAASGGTLDAMTGATTVIASGTVNAGAGDNTPSAVQNIGFSFSFNGTAYTQYSVSPDGFVRLGGTAATSEATNSVVSANNLPKLYPLWDDIATGSNGNVKALVTGTAPNRILKLQWFVTVPRALSGTANSTFQAWLYESTNVIEYRYGAMGTVASGSIGATAAAANYQSVTVSTNTASTSTPNNTNAASPNNGRIYRLSPSAAGFTYLWDTVPTGGAITNATSSNATANPTATTVYSLTVSNGGCSASSTVTATLQDNPVITDDPRETTVCAGQTATFTVTATGPGLTYQWYKGVAPTGVAINTTTNPSAATSTLTLTNVPFSDNGSNYYVVVTSSCGPTSTATSPSPALTVNQLPTINVNSGSICSPGGTPLTLTASGASTYAWSPAGGLSATTGATVTATPTSTTVYTVSGTDANGCVNTATSTVTVSSSISATATATPPAVCTGGNSQLNVVATALNGVIKITEVVVNRGGTGGGTYPSYAPGADLVEISNISASPVDISGWLVQDYTTNSATVGHAGFAFPAGTILPANGVTIVCLGTGTNDVANRYFTTGGTSDTYFSGGLVGIVMKNGASVVDAVGLNTGYVFAAGTGVTAGDWSGIASSPSGIAGTTRTAPADSNAGSDWTAASAGTPQTIGVYNAGYINPVTIASYAWSPATFLSATNIANPMANGVTSDQTYSVLVTTTGGCTATATTTITVQPFAGLAATATSPRCAGSNFTVTANVSGGGAPYTYSWSDGSATVYPATATITANKPAGTYTFTATVSDTCGGTVTSQVTVTVNALPTVTLSSGSICNPGGVAATLTATGASTYTYTNNTSLTPTTGAVVSANPTATTTYVVTGTDANGCINTASGTVQVVTKPINVTASANPSTVCPGGITTLSGTGGVGIVANQYTFTGSTGTYTPITGTTLDASSIGDDVGVGNLPIGFPFTYNGVSETVFGASSNGFIQLGNTTVAITGFSANALASTAKVIAPLWEDNNTTGGSIIYATTGAVGSRVLTVQWTGMHVGLSGGASQPTIDVQLKLYEANSSVQLIYGPTSAALTSTSASIGISGASGNYVSVTPLSPASTSTTSTTTENTTISAATNFPSGTVYTFAPAVNNADFSWAGQTTSLVSPNSQSTATNALSMVDGSQEVFTLTASVPGVPTCSVTATTTVTVSNTSGTAPTIDTQPVSAAVCVGQTATFSVAATGATLTYQWFKNGVAINTATNPSAATATLTLTNVALADNGAVYTVQINSNCAFTTSDATAVLSVTALPVVAITISETSGLVNNDGTICSGAPITLTASGGGTYLWSTTETTAAINPTPVVGSTTYTVTVTTLGCSSTASKIVTVNANPTAPLVSSNSPICAGSTLNLTGNVGPLTGYNMNTNSGVAFVDINATGTTVVGALGDDTEHNITIPSFTFNGNAYTTARVGTNGLVVFGSTTGEVSLTNAALPSTANTAGNVFLAPYWDDLDIQTGATIKTQTVGNLHIIQFTTMAHNDFTTGSITYQVQLNLTTGVINFVYPDVLFGNAAQDAGLSAAIGIQYSGTSALQYSNNTASLVNNQSITFSPLSYGFAWTGPSFTSTVQNPSIANATTAATGSYSLEITDINGCKANASTNVVVNPLHTIALNSGSGSTTPTLCINTPLTNIVYDLGGGATGATVSGLPTGLSGATNAGVYTISGSPSQSGTFAYTVTTTGNNCTVATASGTITVTPNNTVTLTSGPGTNAQTVFTGSPIVTITYSTTGATGATFSGLPSGTSGNWSTDIVTINGAPNTPGTYNYTVTLTGGCGNVTATGSITAAGLLNWYLDADNDHYYTGGVVVSGPSPGPGYTTVGLLGGGDCNDSVAAINPGATEICYNNIDDNCNLTLSEGCAPVVVNMNPSYHNTTLPSLATAVPALPYSYAPYTNLKYRFRITNITTNVTAPDIIQVSRFVTIPSSIHSYNAQYTITASAVINEEVVPFAGNTITVNSPTVQLITLNTATCGATLASLTSTLTANAGLNATGYTFRIRLNDANPSPTYAFSQSSTRFVSANSFTGFPLQYATSYKVAVQYTFTDPVTNLPTQSGYGAECTVNTPSIPLTTLASPTCGSQVATMNAGISATSAPYATGYQFRIRLFADNGPTPTYYYTAVNPSRFSSLTSFQGITLTYNTAYSISVQYSILQGSTTVWSGYGADCKVTTPFFPTTSLVPSQCGLATPTSLTQQLNITPYPGFPHYMVKLDEVVGEDVVNSEEREISYSYFRLSDFSIAQLGKNYNVSVKIKLNGVFGDYDTACDLFTAAPGKTVTAIPFKATAYPNPFANNFMLDVKTTSQSPVNLKVYDMVGRLIEQRDVRISDMQTMTIGDRYPTGVYNVVVSQEESVQTVRVVKR